MKKRSFLHAMGLITLMLLAVFSFLACPPPGTDPIQPPGTDPINPGNPAIDLRHKLLILQAYGPTDDNASAASHAFVELYNNTEDEIDLNGYNLWFAEGRRAKDPDFSKTTDKSWNSIQLKGKIPAGSSFLILGKRSPAADGTDGSPRSALQLGNNSGDMNVSQLTLSNRALKIALVYGYKSITVQNPFTGDGTDQISGYIDMVGARNNQPDSNLPNYDENWDNIVGYEKAPTRISASSVMRRKSLDDTDDNSVDFIELRYGTMNVEEVEVRKPRNSSVGEWDPFLEPETPSETSEIMIHQIGAGTDGNISRSFVELYNNSDKPVDLSTYSLQYATGTRGTPNVTTDGPWKKIDLSGSIAPRHSFLILGGADLGEDRTPMPDPALVFANNYGDINIADFYVSNRSFKIALMSNQTLLTTTNPFSPTKNANLVDLVGAMNTVGVDKINAYEGTPIGTLAFQSLNKQTGQRRKALNDTDNNGVDFMRAIYVNATEQVKERLRPKNSAYGAWNPITGAKE